LRRLAALLAVWTALAALPGAAGAAELSYTYLEAGYNVFDDRDLDFSGTQWSVYGSRQVSPGAYLFGGYRHQDGDLSFSGMDYSADSDALEGGIGAKQPVRDDVDLNVEVAVLVKELKTKGASSALSDSDTGFGMAMGLRARVTPRIEANGAVGFVNIFDNSSTGVNLGTVVRLTGPWDLAAYAGVSETVVFVEGGLRYTF
jgi:hypothetical protein